MGHKYQKTAVRSFSIRKYLAAVLILTILRIEWLRFPRVPSQPPQLALSDGFLFESLSVGATQLALLGEMLSHFFVGAPPNLLCWRNASLLGPCLRLALLPQESRHKYYVLTCNFTFKCFKNKAVSIIISMGIAFLICPRTLCPRCTLI